MTIVEPTTFDIYGHLLLLLTCLCEKLTESELPQPCSCVVLPGAVTALDGCNPCGGEKCGTAWVRLNSIYQSTVFPIQDLQYTGCGDTMLALDVEMGIARCAPTGDTSGNPPTVAQYQAAAELQMADMRAMYDAVHCCFVFDLRMLGAYTPIGPEGGCVGGAWQLWMGRK